MSCLTVHSVVHTQPLKHSAHLIMRSHVPSPNRVTGFACTTLASLTALMLAADS